MMGASVTLSLFMLLNAARVLAYVPQIVKIGRDTHGAAAVSVTTWTMFTLSNGSTAAYALHTVGDAALAAIFGVNTAFCAASVIMTLMRRRSFRRRGAPGTAFVPAGGRMAPT